MIRGRRTRLRWPLLLCLGAQLAACAGHSAEPALAELDIPFLTTRRLAIGDDGEVDFSADVGATSAGRCAVTLVREEETEARNGPVTTASIEQVMGSFAGQAEPGVLVYIHGYNIGLERACRDAARLAFATGFEGRTLLFSWPASRTLVTYRRDERRLAESMPAILAALDDLGARYGRSNISIVMHSMGSRVTLAMSERAGQAGSAEPFDDLVLVAPDIERERFRAAAPGLQTQVRNISILVSGDDKLLMLSELVNRNERLGQISDFDIEGVRVVDVSGIDDLGPTGHIYHLENERVGELLRRILQPSAGP